MKTIRCDVVARGFQTVIIDMVSILTTPVGICEICPLLGKRVCASKKAAS
jgi:hypothetical protein